MNPKHECVSSPTSLSVSKLAVLALIAAGLSPARTSAQPPQPPTPTVLNLTTFGSPSARAGHAMCEMNGLVYLFGGHDNLRFLNDTWVYRPTANTWSLVPTNNSPSPRRWTRMVKDPLSDTIVLFGGDTPVGDSAECWRFTGTDWMQVPGGPPARWAHAMAADTTRGRIVMYGGYNQSDTWELGPNGWQQVSTPTSPGALQYASMVHDPRRGVTLLHGGARSNGAYENRCWDYNGSWTLRPEVTPTNVMGAAATYDTSRRRVVLFGGQSAPLTPTTTIYEHDGSAWHQRPVPFGRQTPRYGGGAAFVVPGLGGATLIFGGAVNGAVLNDTLTYRISPTAGFYDSSPGCGGLRLEVFEDRRPWLGDTYVRRALIPAPAFCVLATGFATANIDLTLAGMPGCTLGTTAVITSVHYSQGDWLSFPLVLPASLQHQGFTLVEQLFMLQPGVNPAGILASNTLVSVCNGK